jgi:hypothetical protein
MINLKKDPLAHTSLSLYGDYVLVECSALVGFHQFNQFHFRCKARTIKIKIVFLTYRESSLLGSGSIVQTDSVRLFHGLHLCRMLVVKYNNYN